MVENELFVAYLASVYVLSLFTMISHYKCQADNEAIDRIFDKHLGWIHSRELSLTPDEKEFEREVCASLGILTRDWVAYDMWRFSRGW